MSSTGGLSLGSDDFASTAGSPEAKSDRLTVNDVLHHKCPVVQLVRHQMTSLDYRVMEELAEIKRCKSFCNRLWRNKSFLALLLLLPFLLWLALVYGAIAGASLCAGKTCAAVHRHRFTPGMSYTRNTHSIY